ncbi:MAG: Na+/H+ antiporter subunit C [Rhodobacteraceae bacterium]|nr:MAG: Na+/H+ antiporter subunit C [Paracoccaceae bacterium]
MTSEALYAAVALALFGLGWAGLLLKAAPLRKLIALNVMSLGALMLLVAFAWRPDAPPDPVPHALAITGIVVAVAATALGLVLIRRVRADRDR